jgi:hypothetical protein
MRADMGKQYHAIARRQVDRVLMRERLKGIFTGAGETSEDLDDDTDDDTDDDAYAAALEYLLHSKDGAAVLRRVFGSRGVTSIADLEGLARRVAHVMRNTASGDDECDSFQPWPDADDNADAERVAATKSFLMTPREAVLRRLVKSCGGVQTLCKQIVRDGASDLTEHELTALIVEQAKIDRPVMSDAQAFAKAFGSASPAGETLRRAVAIAKGAPAPQPASDDDDGIGDGADALAELERHAERLRAAQPSLSFQQAFARVYSDPQHAHLVRRERRQNNPVLKLAR